MTNKSISQLSAGSAVSGTDLFPDVQTVGVGPVKVTASQIKTFTSASPTFSGNATFTTPSTTTAAYEYWNNGSVNVSGIGGYSDDSTSGHLEFYTTTGSTLTERLRLSSSGNLTLTGTESASISLRVNKAITGATTSYGIRNDGEIQSGVTTAAYGYDTGFTSVGTAFTIPSIFHYNSSQGSFGSTTVNNQYGFYVSSTLTSAINNYGFYSNIASSSGRWNFYAAGTASNYFAGKVAIGAAPFSDTVGLSIGPSATGGTVLASTNSYIIAASDVTTALRVYYSQAGTAAASFTLNSIQHFAAQQLTFGLGSTVTNQYGFLANSTLTSAINNYGFYSNIASSSGRWNFYAAGTAANYFAGSITYGSILATASSAPTIASASTIAPTTPIVFVSGVAAIDTITAPSPISSGGGQITIIPTGVFTTTNAGNIAIASTAVVSKALIMTYDATTTKWYPSY